MNEEDLKVMDAVMTLMNKAHFRMKAPEMVMSARLLQRFADVVKRHRDALSLKQVKKPAELTEVK